MYDRSKTDEMIQNGFWPMEENGIIKMATAMGNIQYRPELIDQFELKDGEIHGEIPGLIIVYSPNWKIGRNPHFFIALFDLLP